MTSARTPRGVLSSAEQPLTADSLQGIGYPLGPKRLADPSRCMKRAEGWRSPLVTAPGTIAYQPCPECGCVHHRVNRGGQ